MPVFHAERRRLLSQAFFDIFKFVTIGGCVSGFFKEFSSAVKVGVSATAVIALLLGFAFCPKRDNEKEGRHD